MRSHRSRNRGVAAIVASAVLLIAGLVAMGGPGAAAPRTTSARANAANAKLINQIAAARLATAKYATNLHRAKEDGYGIITPMIPNMGIHFMNPNVQGFDVRKPPILVYEHRDGRWQLGALEWVFTSMPTTPPLDNATFGFFPAACHYVDGTFVAQADQSKCPKKSPQSGAAFNFWHPGLFTMHLWIWYPNPAGLYSGTNPLITPFNGG